MRAALVVRTCSACLPGQVSLAGSTSAAACECAANNFLDQSVAANRAIALLPGTTQFSTRARRTMRTYAATAPFTSGAGPSGTGAVTFDPAHAQYLDGGPHTFNIATNGGFTAVAVLRFTGALVSDERIFDFGRATSSDNIMLWRSGGTNSFALGFWNGAASACQIQSTSVFASNVWTTVVVKYTSSNRFLEMRIGTSVTTATCATAIANRDVLSTNVGRSFWTPGFYARASIAGLYAVDAALPEAEIAALIARMHRGADPLQACAACPSQSASAQGSVGEDTCQCAAGSLSAAVSARVPSNIRQRAVVVEPSRAQLAALAGRETGVVDQKTLGTGWRLVRYLPPTSATWYSGDDNLVGAAPRGTAYNNFSEWSLQFGEFDEFCFSTANFAHWLQCTKVAAVGATYTDVARDIIRSSIDDNTYTARWYNRGGAESQDPWIGLRNHLSGTVNTEGGDRILYVEGSFSAGHVSLPIIALDGGMNVWVRSSGNKPAVSLTGGPGGGPALTFDRTQAQFLDGGARTFNIASNGGFTLVAVVMMTGTLSNSERILSFSNNDGGLNIIVARTTGTRDLWVGIDNPSVVTCGVNLPNVLVQDSWITIIGTLSAATNVLRVEVGASNGQTTCNPVRIDMIFTRTFVGKSTWASDPFTSMTLAGLYAVDALLTPAQIAALAASMHAGLDAQEVCRACPAGLTSAAGAVGGGACTCAAGQFKTALSPGPRERAVVLVANRPHEFASLATRAAAATPVPTTRPTFAAAGGAVPFGRAVFARTSQQFLDGGSRTLNIASNGGFTAVAVFRFTGALGDAEKILDLGSGQDVDNIILSREATTSGLGYGIRNGNANCFVSSPTNTVPQDTWTTVVATYHPTASATGTVRLQVGMNQYRTACTALRANRIVTTSYVGRSSWAGDAYLNGEIAGLHVVDALLSSVETAVIAARMRAGTDPLAGCATCATGLRGPCGYMCPAGKFAVTANLFAVNLDDLTVWYEFEGDARDTVSNELIMAQFPAVGAIGTFAYTAPASGVPEEAHARHVALNPGAHVSGLVTKYYVTPLGHDVPLSIVAWVKITGTGAHTLFGVSGSLVGLTDMGIQVDISVCDSACVTNKVVNMEVWTALGGPGNGGDWTLAHNGLAGLTFPHNTWFHFAYTLTQRPLSVGTLYVNGVLRNTLTSTTTTGLAAFDRIVVGASGELSRSFIGELGDLRVYRRALSLAEVGLLFAYKTYEHSNCQTCPSGQTSLVGAQAASECFSAGVTCPSNSLKTADGSACVCNAGFEAGAGGTCPACASGKYAAVAGVACANPPANAFTPNTVSFLCNAGFSEPVVANACSACAAGKYKETSGNDALDCLDCKDFSESPPSTISAASCLCVQGYAAEGSALDTCVECAQGKYKAGSANAACTDCPGGSTTLADKAFDLSLCVADAGFFKNNGLFEACPAGSFKSQEGDVACSPCPTHSTTPAAGAVASSQCVCVAPKYQALGSACGCAPGFFYVAASLTCEPCPAGSFCLGTLAGGSLAATTATLCPSNSESDAGALSEAACACKPGYSGLNTACTLCLPGSYKATTGPGPCDPCPSDATSGAGSTSATQCLCNAGFTETNALCERCAPNTYKAATGPAPCDECTAFSTSPAGSELAAACVCDLGYSLTSGACAPCAAGSYGLGCVLCPANSFSPAGSQNSSMCECNAGFSGPNGGACTACAAGSFKVSAGNASCVACNANATSLAASTHPLNCSCVPGYSGPSGGPCAACADSFKPLAGSANCTACPANAQAPEGSTINTACRCNEGYSGADGAACSVCQGGTFKTGAGPGTCQTCLANSSSPAASSICECNAGFSGANGDTCTLCAPGLIKPTSGPAPCLPDFNRINSERQQAIALASQARAQLEISKAKCTDSTKLMLCPTSDAVPVDMRAACVGAMAECFVVDGVFDATALGAYKTEKQSACPNAGDRFCDQEGICVGAGASCAPATKCLPEQSFRCPNWACAADAAGCDAAATPPACPAGEQRCPDALCYPGTGGMQECARAGVNWKGCPPGFQECTNGKDGTCGTDAADCEAKVGCPANLVFCGILRDANGTASINPATSRPFAKCVEQAACLAGQDRPPVDITAPLDPSVAGSIAAVSADGQPAMELRMGAGAFTVNGIAQAVTFSVGAVPDSLVQQGAFGSLFESGSLVASLIQIQASAAVEVVGGLILDIPILDEQANLDPALCDLILANTRMLSISDITDVTQEPSAMGTCTKGVIGGCSCAVSVTHFSTFTVADVSVQSQSCPSNRFMVTRVVNPPYAMRTFTTRSQGTGVLQLLPWNLFATPWRPTAYDTAQYMQIDLGQELTVLGIRTQNSGGIGTTHTAAFQLHHAASTGGYTVQSQVHTLTNNHPTNIILTTSFHARYVRVLVTRWNSMLGISAALVVRMCSQCIDGAVSVLGSVSASACQCAMNTYLDVSATATRAIALMPGTTLFTTLARRADMTQISTAVFDSSAGPPNARGAVTFLASANQYIDGGAHTFDIASGGFTAVMLIKFTGTPNPEERIFSFGTSENWDDIVMYRSGSTNHFAFVIFEGGAGVCFLLVSPDFTPSIWTTVVVKYVSSDGFVEIKFNAYTETGTCPPAIATRTVLHTLIGRGFSSTVHGSAQSVNAAVAGFYAVDRLLSAAETSDVVARMGRGESVLEACVACSGTDTSAQGAIGAGACVVACQSNSRKTADGSACVCNAGFQASAGNLCTSCAAGTYGLGCVLCPPNSTSPPASTSAAACTCQAGYSEIQMPAPYDTCVNDECDANTLSGVEGWRLVRFLPVGSDRWHQAVDYLAGTDIYGGTSGIAVTVAGSWSVPFYSFDEFFISNNDKSLWLYTTRVDVQSTAGIDPNTGLAIRSIFRSSSKPTGPTYSINWHVGTYAALPVIAVISNDEGIVYAGMSTISHPGYINWARRDSHKKGGMVFVRNTTRPIIGTCAACLAGTFKNETGPAACRLCPAFASSAEGSTLRTNCTCGAGYKGVPGGACGKICPPGAQPGPLDMVCYTCNASTYKALAGDHACTPCPAFSHHTLTNQTRVEACVCQIGYLWNANTQGCSKCATGTFNNMAGETQCYACVSTSTALKDETTCPGLSVAPAGLQATSSGANLEPCPVNTYNDGSLLACTPCPLGSYTAQGGLTSIAQCECLAGYERVAGVCSACHVGSYKAAAGDGSCAACLGDTTTQETASTSITQCVCEADFGLAGGACEACVRPAQKLHPGNEACIDCGPNSALDPDASHNNRTACECLAGYAGDWRGCDACLTGFYKAHAGAGECAACADYATTAANASTSIADCFCAPPEVWEPGPLGPDVVNGACVPVCAAGSTGSAGVCNLCAAGKFKPVAGSAACSTCTAPLSASLLGSVQGSACTCPAGFIDNYGTEYVYVSSVGALSVTTLNETVLCQGFGNGVPCAVAADPARRLHALKLSPAVNATLRDVTVTVSHRGGSLLLYACTTDCERNHTINLHGQPGALVIAASGSASAALSRHVGRTVTLSRTPTFITQAQAEQTVLRYSLRPGDAMWVPVSGGTASCEPCPRGAVCL